jgi:hypothetical protein
MGWNLLDYLSKNHLKKQVISPLLKPHHSDGLPLSS